MEKIYVFLPVYNRREITQSFIECLKIQTYQNYHLILIDDGSIDNTEEMVRSQIQNLTVIKGNGDWWWAGSLQQATKWLTSNTHKDQDNIVLIINDDVTFDQYFLEMGINLIQAHPNSLILAQSLDRKTGNCEETGIDADFKTFTFTRANSPEKINCLSTKGLLLTHSCINKIGGFYPHLLPHYLSDYEFSIRAFKKGFKLKTFTSFALYQNQKTTGLYRTIDFSQFSIKEFFSKKSTINPFYSSIFIILTCPKIWIPANIIRIWIRTTRLLLTWLLKYKIE
jgi:GT2 family glycosyltransferase